MSKKPNLELALYALLDATERLSRAIASDNLDDRAYYLSEYRERRAAAIKALGL